jgi:hypothetical protein
VSFQPQLVRDTTLIPRQRQLGKTLKAIAQELDMTEYHIEHPARIVKRMEQ